jgi:hypothetical protein
VTSFSDAVAESFVEVVGAIAAGFFGLRATATAWIAEIQQIALAALPNTRLSPADAAVATVKGIVTGLDLADEALTAGVTAERFQALVDMSGNPPGPETLLTMLNRGAIEAPDVTRGIQQGFIKDEYATPYFALQYNLLGPEQYVEADLQNAPVGVPWETLWAQAGMLPSEYATAKWITGNPPGPMQLVELFNRGYIDMATLRQGLSESRLKDKWIDAFLNLANTQIPVRELIDAVKAGAVDQATAAKLFANLGYSPDLAAILIQSGTSATATAHKELSLSMVKSLYEDKIIAAPQATADLILLGYTADDAALYLSLLDAAVTQRFQNLAISKVRTGFDARKIGQAQASTDLDTLGIGAAQRDQLLTLWALEQAANPKALTLGEYNDAFKYGVLTQADYLSAVEALGYSADDAVILAGIVNKGPIGAT